MERIVRADLQASYLLHRRPFRETSFLLEVFSRQHGRLPLVARGARRTRRGAGVELQPFRRFLLTFSMRGEMGTLHGFEPAEAATPMPHGTALPSAFYANELLMRLMHRFDPHPVLFDLYARLLSSLDASQSREPALRVFEKRLLEEIGYGLVLDRDADSGAPIGLEQRYLYIADRGPQRLRAGQVDPHGPVVHGATLRALADETVSDTRTLRECKQLMRHVIEYHLGGRPLKSRTMFRVPP